VEILLKKSCRTICPINNRGFTVAAESNGSVLVEATDFFITWCIASFNNLAKQQTRQLHYWCNTKCNVFAAYQNFPLNTEFETTVTFVNRDGKPGNYIVTWYPKPLHCGCTTFLQLPDNNFKTRLYDGRSPYITILILIIVHHHRTHSKNYIRRHRLQKRKTHLLQKWSNKTHHLLFR
jgi:hypothetical protein